MEVIYVAAPAALLLGAVFVAAFIWAVGRGEMDDLSTPPVRMLFDDEKRARGCAPDELNNDDDASPTPRPR